MKFRVWTEQINQDHFDVEARDEADARQKAIKEWYKVAKCVVIAILGLKETASSVDNTPSAVGK